MFGRLIQKDPRFPGFRLSPSLQLITSTSLAACSVRMSSKFNSFYVPRVLLSPLIYRVLATCSADTTVKIWSISSNYEFKQEKVLLGHQRWVWDAAFSADSAYLVTGNEPRLRIQLQ